MNSYPWYFERGLSVGTGAITPALKCTIEPGAVLLMGGGRSLSVIANAHLVAVGTAQKRITIKGFADQTGYWQGLHVQSQTPGTIIDYCDISNGGGRRNNDSSSGIIVLGRHNTYLEIYNSTLSKSLTHGINFYYSSRTNNSSLSCYLKHANVTHSGIGGSVFFIYSPTSTGYNALPTMSGTDWWRWF